MENYGQVELAYGKFNFLSTGFPQARQGYNLCLVSITKSFPHFPQPLLLLFNIIINLVVVVNIKAM